MNKFKHYYYNAILKEADKKGGKVYNVDLSRSYINELPSFFKDLTVFGNLDLTYNKLTSCKNFPKVGNSVEASDNNIKSLEGLQNLPHNYFHFTMNKIESLESLPGLKGHPVAFNVAYNELTSLKGLESVDIRTLRSHANKISSWEGIPPFISELQLGANKLTSWHGMPSQLNRLHIIYNWDVKNLDGYEEVDDTLEFSTTNWTNKYEFAQYMESKNIKVPGNIFITNPKHEQI